MRVLLVTHYYPGHRSGVELTAGHLAGRLAGRGVELVWAATGPPDGVPAGVTPLPIRAWNGVERATGFAYPIWHPTDLRRLARAVHTADAVHLHEHLYPGNLFARREAGRIGVPVVITQHTSQIWWSSGLPAGMRAMRAALAVTNRTFARWALGGADRAVFISAKARDYYAHLFDFRRPAEYVPNGLDTALFRPADESERRGLRRELGWPNDRPVMLFVGRMIEKKGLPALRDLAGRFPQYDWAFAGWGPVDPRSWGHPNVRYLGPADQTTLARYYRAADLFVLPSLTEGFPLVVQESLACGTPAVLSADIAAGAPGVDRVLHVWRPEAEPLADLIRRVMADPATWPARRQAAADYARRTWDWDVCTDHYLRLFEGLLNPGDGPPATGP
jgi:glycosyltransferase involved in cell wall biosynthesis